MPSTLGGKNTNISENSKEKMSSSTQYTDNKENNFFHSTSFHPQKNHFRNDKNEKSHTIGIMTINAELPPSIVSFNFGYRQQCE